MMYCCSCLQRSNGSLRHGFPQYLPSGDVHRLSNKFISVHTVCRQHCYGKNEFLRKRAPLWYRGLVHA